MALTDYLTAKGFDSNVAFFDIRQTVPLSEQIKQFSSEKDNLTAMTGLPETEVKLNQSLFFISIGSNDIFHYFSSNSGISVDEFIALTISSYSGYIKVRTVECLFINQFKEMKGSVFSPLISHFHGVRRCTDSEQENSAS